MSRYQTASNIRVSVHFLEPVVFAGEDVACTITFKNIARAPGARDRSPQYNAAPGDRSRKVTPLLPQGRPQLVARHSGYTSNVPLHLRKGHRPTNSLGRLDGNTDDGNATHGGVEGIGYAQRPRHGRSLSVVSMGTDAGTVLSMPGRDRQEHTGRPSHGHERTMSAHTGSGRVSSGRSNSGQASESITPQVAAPVIADQGSETTLPVRHGRPGTVRSATDAQKSPDLLKQSFRFPADPPNANNGEPNSPANSTSGTAIQSASKATQSLSPTLSDMNSNPISRVLSKSSANGSPRSSLDLQSEVVSNHSDETFISEYVPQQVARLLPRPNHTRTNSRLGVRTPPRGPETIMMGYVQVNGSFTLEGSLINQAPFEEVKRKGVVGSHGGGGVVGVERSKRDSGLFGSFGWGNIGESIGGLLGGGELSSIKEMRGIASSKSIPLVTTPPSILFVELRLAPGEQQSYSYRFTLPRGLPPSHKGRAVKVSYQLVIGTQRAGSGKEQQVRSVDVPFRIFGSVDPRGEILGHDLMSPYILLRDQAKTGILGSASSIQPDKKPKKPPDQKGEGDFLGYVDALLDKSSLNGHPALLSPTSMTADPMLNAMRRQSSVGETLQSQLDMIDFSILRSNHMDQRTPNGLASLSNKFDIARSGQHVATLHIPRPAYRLGETIQVVAKFSNASIPTFAIQVALESHETVDAAIAMRSAASISRYTRKVHAFDAANALYARRLSFALGIPSSATPEFMTSGISLDWRLRVQFVTPRLTSDRGRESDESLLEEVAIDDRGVILQGVEALKVETFEVAVPIRVYGGISVAGPGGESDVKELPI